MRNIRTNKGITLIALVITIIVLLILAAVSIATLTGENGILTKANTAKNQTIEAEEKEQISLAYSTVIADKLDNGKEAVATANELQAELNNQNAEATTESKGSNQIEVTFTKSKNVYTVDGGTGKITGTGNGGGEVYNTATTVTDAITQNKPFKEETPIKDSNNQTIKIPAGFKIASDSAELVEEGIVIEDSTANHNQFVWVPVDNAENFVRTEGYYNGKLDTLLDGCSEPFANGYRSETTSEESEYNTMRKSVEDNNGFYIGRYEAGKDTSTSGNVVVKKGADVYNNVPWGNAMDDIEGTTNTNGKVGAVKLAKEFATNNNYQGVTSTLCYGVQWDAALKFIDTDYTGFAKDSTKQGWYKDNYNQTDTEKNTQTNPNHITGKDLIYNNNLNVVANKQKNIYDMAGNVNEWTMEAYYPFTRVVRGGGFGSSNGSYIPASYRFQRNTGRCIRQDRFSLNFICECLTV